MPDMSRFDRLPPLWVDLKLVMYLRMSLDKDGRALGIARQDDEASDLIRGYGANPEAVPRYPDNDLSATSGKVRPEFRRMLGAVNRGDVHVIVAYSIDRLTRKVAEMLDLIERRSPEGFRAIATVHEGIFDLGTASGRNRAIEAAAKAQYEAEHKGERHVSQHVQAAAAGRRHGGTHNRPFGYVLITEGEGRYKRVIREELEPTEAKLIEEAAERHLKGEGWRSIARDYYDRGVVGTNGAPMSGARLMRIVSSGRVSGRREHLGEIVSETAMWPKIIEPETSDKIRAKSSPAPAEWVMGRKYLGTGVLYCSRCGYHLVGRRGGHPGYKVYICHPTTTGGGCGRLTIGLTSTDEFLRTRLLHAFRGEQFMSRLLTNGTDEADSLIEQLTEVEDDLADLSAALGARKMRFKDYAPAHEGLSRARDDLLARIGKNESVSSLVEFQRMEGTLGERWERMGLGQRRSLLKAAIVRIDVQPARKMGCKFDTWRLSHAITWAA